jgi:hypothetical protein
MEIHRRDCSSRRPKCDMGKEAKTRKHTCFVFRDGGGGIRKASLSLIFPWPIPTREEVDSIILFVTVGYA